MMNIIIISDAILLILMFDHDKYLVNLNYILRKLFVIYIDLKVL